MNRLQAEPEAPAGESAWLELVGTLPHILWITRPDGYCVYINQQWMSFTGLTLEESLGAGWIHPFHPDEQPLTRRLWAEASASGEPFEIEYRLRRHDGVYRWMLGRALPLCNESGEIVRWSGTCTDIEELKVALDSAAKLGEELERRALEQEQLAAFNQAALDAVPAPTIVVGLPSGDIRHANRAWRDFHTRYGIEPGRGDSVEVLGVDVSNLGAELLAKVAESDHGVSVKYQCVLEDELRWFDLRAEPLDKTWELAVLSHWDITTEVRAQRKLEDAATEKNELIATVSHELRTPLTAVLGIAAILNGDPGSADLAELLVFLEEQAAEAAAIVEDLLVATQVAVGQIKVSLEPIDVAETLAHVRLAEHNVSVEETASPIVANADPARVRQIVRNLLSNAARYGGKTVELAISSNGDRVLVRVSDNGAGIAEDDAETVFEPYQRAAGVDRSDSVGLGLTLSRRLARLMNGDLSYRRENGWTVFELELEASEPVLLIPHRSSGTLQAITGFGTVDESENRERDGG
jgi:PAS domain S-box-containing protein